MIFPQLEAYLHNATQQFGNIPEERKQALTKISQYVAKRLDEGLKAKLVYICTHNSRRSHFGQIWAKTAASFYDLKEVETFSGGTEATAFNANAIAAAKRAGFEISSDGKQTNPVYSVVYSKVDPRIICYSKKHDGDVNPQEGFCAIMTCTEADGACPVVAGSTARLSTPYNDPKAFDNTEQQDIKYDERCLQIAIETLYAFSLVKQFSKTQTFISVQL